MEVTTRDLGKDFPAASWSFMTAATTVGGRTSSSFVGALTAPRHRFQRLWRIGRCLASAERRLNPSQAEKEIMRAVAKLAELINEGTHIHVASAAGDA